MKYPNQLRAIRKATEKDLAIKVTDIAKKLGITFQHYYALERGEKQLTAENLKKLTEILNASSDEILGNSPKENVNIDITLKDPVALLYIKQSILPLIKNTALKFLGNNSLVAKSLEQIDDLSIEKQIEFIKEIVENVEITNNVPKVTLVTPDITTKELAQKMKSLPVEERKALLVELLNTTIY